MKINPVEMKVWEKEPLEWNGIVSGSRYELVDDHDSCLLAKQEREINASRHNNGIRLCFRFDSCNYQRVFSYHWNKHNTAEQILRDCPTKKTDLSFTRQQRLFEN